MATFTTRLGLRLPDPTDLVAVTSDINASMSAIDAAIGLEIVTALPLAPYKGKPVTVSTDSYRSYFHNGTTPASGGWVETLNSSGTFGSNVKLASGSQIVFGGDTNLFRNAASVLRTNDALTVDLDLTVSGAGSITGAVALGNTLSVASNLSVAGSAMTVKGDLWHVTTGTTIDTWTAIPFTNSWSNSANPPAGRYRRISSPPNSIEVVGRVSHAAVSGTSQLSTALPYVPAHAQDRPVATFGNSASAVATPVLSIDATGVLSFFNLPTGTTSAAFHVIYSLDA